MNSFQNRLNGFNGRFAGQKIANIYDYTYAMDAVKIGQPVKIIVLREGKRVELMVTPTIRK